MSPRYSASIHIPIQSHAEQLTTKDANSVFNAPYFLSGPRGACGVVVCRESQLSKRPYALNRFFVERVCAISNRHACEILARSASPWITRATSVSFFCAEQNDLTNHITQKLRFETSTLLSASFCSFRLRAEAFRSYQNAAMPVIARPSINA
jgi:hypothetical protein